jgi:hypothetical protein
MGCDTRRWLAIRMLHNVESCASCVLRLQTEGGDQSSDALLSAVEHQRKEEQLRLLNWRLDMRRVTDIGNGGQVRPFCLPL